MTRKINLIVIHCSATPSGKRLQQGTPGKPGFLNAPQVINAWHAARSFKRNPEAVRKFNSTLPSIGYHFVVDIDGQVFTGRGLDEVGAHAAGFNGNSIGICLIGGVEREGRYTPAQWKSLREVVLWQAKEQTVPLSAPLRGAATPETPAGFGVAGGICGHRDLSPDTNANGQVEAREWLKTCPGFDVAAWLQRGLVPERQHVVVDGDAA